MPSRDPNFRDEVLKLDGYRCQVCGFDGRDESHRSSLEADHVVPLGMGGSDEMDVVENGMTLCKSCHRKKTDGLYRVVRWDRDDDTNGLNVINEETGELVDCESLWFYVKQHLEDLEQAITSLSAISMAESAKARLMALVWDYYSLVDAASPQQLVAKIGLDPNIAKEEAMLYKYFERLDVEWPSGVNVAKAKLIKNTMISNGVDINHETLDYWRNLLYSASDMSYTDIEDVLTRDGYLSTPEKKQSVSVGTYLEIPLSVFLRDVRIHIGTAEDILDELAADRVFVKASKFAHPVKKHGSKVIVDTGSEEIRISVINHSED